MVRPSLNLGLSYRSGGRRGRRREGGGGGAAILNSIVYWNRFGGGGGSSSWLMAILGKPAMIYAPSTSSSNSASFASTFLSLHPHYQCSCSYRWSALILNIIIWCHTNGFRRGFISVQRKERQVLHLCNCKRNTSKYFSLTSHNWFDRSDPISWEPIHLDERCLTRHRLPRILKIFLNHFELIWRKGPKFQLFWQIRTKEFDRGTW